MNDVELESLLLEAGYRYDVASRQYAADGDEDEVGYGTEEIADRLGIPVEDLLRWEEEQQAADDSTPD